MTLTAEDTSPSTNVVRNINQNYTFTTAHSGELSGFGPHLDRIDCSLWYDDVRWDESAAELSAPAGGGETVFDRDLSVQVNEDFTGVRALEADTRVTGNLDGATDIHNINVQ
jgi:hypothetical protein